MGISSHVIFLRSKNDPEFKKKAAVLNACMDAGIEPPEEIMEYFNHSYEEDSALEIEGKVRIWDPQDGGRQGFEIFVSEIPEGTERIRFYNSW